MKTLSALSVAVCLFAVGCGEENKETMASAKDSLSAAAGKLSEAAGELKNLDLGALSGDALEEKASELKGMLADKLSDIKDQASAESARDMLNPILDKLEQAKKMLNDKMPNMDAVKNAANQLKEKFAGDQGVLKVLQPLLDRINALM